MHRNVEQLPELLNAGQVGYHILGVSKRRALDYNRWGTIPAPITIGTRSAWRKREILDWIAAGCPHRDNWRWHDSEQGQPITLEQAIDYAGGIDELRQVIDVAGDHLSASEYERILENLNGAGTAPEAIQQLVDKVTEPRQAKAKT